jgi:hypothetical protein
LIIGSVAVVITAQQMKTKATPGALSMVSPLDCVR